MHRGDSVGLQESVHRVPCLGGRERRTGPRRHSVRRAVKVARGGAQDTVLRAVGRRHHKQEQGGTRVLLPEGLAPVAVPPRSGEREGQEQVGPAVRHMGGRREVGARRRFLGEGAAHNGVWGGWPHSVVHRVGGAGARERFTRAFHEYRYLPHLALFIRWVQEV